MTRNEKMFLDGCLEMQDMAEDVSTSVTFTLSLDLVTENLLLCLKNGNLIPTDPPLLSCPLVQLQWFNSDTQSNSIQVLCGSVKMSSKGFLIDSTLAP